MHLYLIRHAESENNTKPEDQRVEDPAITERGRLQAACLSKWIATLPLDRIITSPFRRAVQTIAPLQAIVSLQKSGSPTIEIGGDIFERGGCYRGWEEANWQGAEGMSPRQILELLPYAQVESADSERGWWASKPRETDDDAQLRAAKAMVTLETRFGPQASRVALITHAEFARLLLVEMLYSSGIDANQFGPIGNAAVTYLTFQQGKWQLQWFNSASHLPIELVTAAKG